MLPLYGFLETAWGGPVSLSAVSILLPFSYPPTQPTWTSLDASDCVKWRSEPAAVVRLDDTAEGTAGCPEGTARSKKVVTIFEPTNSEDTRMSAMITVESPTTGEEAECQIFVDRIEVVKIQTRTKVVHMGEIAPLWIDAYDAKGNLFTSVNTIPFEWDIPNTLLPLDFEQARLWAQTNGANGASSDAGHGGDFHHQFSQEELAELCQQFEKKSEYHMNDWKPVQGTKTGVKPVTARCKAKGHSDSPATAEISVVKPLYLKPPGPVYIVPVCQVQFDLQTKDRRKNAPRVSIRLPDHQYTWSSGKPEYATVEKNGLLSATMKQGPTKITVQDKTAEENKKYAQVRVIEALELILDVTRDPKKGWELGDVGDKTWFLTHGKQYPFRARIKCKYGDMYLCENLVFDVEPIKVGKGQSQKEGTEIAPLFGEEQREADHSIWRLNAKTPGSAQLCVRARPLVNGKLGPYDPKLKTCKTIRITDPVEYKMKGDLWLPFTGHPNKHEYELLVQGGSGRGYVFTSSSPKIATVEGTRKKKLKEHAQAGKVVAAEEGNTDIVACDAYNPTNCAHKLTRVEFPVLVYRGGARETLVGKHLELEFDVLSSSGREYTNSEDIELQSRPEHKFFRTSGKTAKNETSGHWHVTPYAKGPGITRVEVWIVNNGVKKIKHQFIRIAGYSPVKVPELLLITVNEPNRQFAFSGGPLSWKDGTPSVVDIVGENAKKLSYGLDGPGQCTLLCKEVHDQEVEVRVHSPPVEKLPHPAVASASLNVKCLQPLELEEKIVLGVGEERQLVLPEWLEREPMLMKMLQFEVKDNAIISTKKNKAGSFLIKGRRLGKTKVDVKIAHKSLEGLSSHVNGLHAVVHFEVVFKGFEVKSGSKDLLTDSWVFAHIRGLNNEHPDSENFKHVSATWTLNSDLVDILPALEHRDVTKTKRRGLQSVQGPSIRVLGKKPGRAKVKIDVTVDQEGHQREFKVEFTVDVRDSITGPCPCARDHVLVLPEGARADLMPVVQHQKATFSHQSEAISVKNNEVRAVGSAPSDAQILATRSEEPGPGKPVPESLALTVSIRSPAGLLAVPETARPEGPGIVIASRINIAVYLHDDLGRKFTSVKGWAPAGNLRVTSNNPQAVKTELVPMDRAETGVTGQFTLTAFQTGDAVVAIKVEGHPDLQTFIKIRARPRDGHAILRVSAKILPENLFKLPEQFGPAAAYMIQTMIADAVDAPTELIAIDRLDLSSRTLEFRILRSSATDVNAKTPNRVAEDFLEAFWKRGRGWGFDLSSPPVITREVLTGAPSEPVVIDESGTEMNATELEFVEEPATITRSRRVTRLTRISRHGSEFHAESAPSHWLWQWLDWKLVGSLLLAILVVWLTRQIWACWNPRKELEHVGGAVPEYDLSFFNPRARRARF